MTQDPLTSAIQDALTLMEGDHAADDALMGALDARLQLARAAADTEIHELAVEGLQETLSDAAADPDPDHKAALLDALQASMASYLIQLQIETMKGERG